MTDERRIVYLAAPYSHPNCDVRQFRYEMATAAAARLVAEGHVVFSPLTMTHPIDSILAGAGNSLGSDYWVAYDEAFMAICSEINVLKLEGWENSMGVAREIRYFESQGLPVTFIDVEQPTVAEDLRKAA